jgi:VanZ family protein
MNKKSKFFFYYWLPLLLYCVLIYSLSSDKYPVNVPKSFSADKFIHFFAYAFLGLLIIRAFATLRIKENIVFLIIISTLLSTLYGLSDEMHQYFVPYRCADVKDVYADLLGSAFGVYVYYLLSIKYHVPVLIPGLTNLCKFCRKD